MQKISSYALALQKRIARHFAQSKLDKEKYCIFKRHGKRWNCWL